MRNKSSPESNLDWGHVLLLQPFYKIKMKIKLFFLTRNSCLLQMQATGRNSSGVVLPTRLVLMKAFPVDFLPTEYMQLPCRWGWSSKVTAGTAGPLTRNEIYGCNTALRKQSDTNRQLINFICRSENVLQPSEESEFGTDVLQYSCTSSSGPNYLSI